ncbi:hypothetical protein [Martelella sp. HB161492]|uniref:hypothetical protein n=1 Tax=Martelella sp. HB161492 TaxID=2720726 RepID=UPI001590EEA0|nr:hypothetical protein [Martelella sp. HB161492]
MVNSVGSGQGPAKAPAEAPPSSTAAPFAGSASSSVGQARASRKRARCEDDQDKTFDAGAGPKIGRFSPQDLARLEPLDRLVRKLVENIGDATQPSDNVIQSCRHFSAHYCELPEGFRLQRLEQCLKNLFGLPESDGTDEMSKSRCISAAFRSLCYAVSISSDWKAEGEDKTNNRGDRIEGIMLCAKALCNPAVSEQQSTFMELCGYRAFDDLKDATMRLDDESQPLLVGQLVEYLNKVPASQTSAARNALEQAFSNTRFADDFFDLTLLQNEKDHGGSATPGTSSSTALMQAPRQDGLAGLLASLPFSDPRNYRMDKG